MARSRLNSKGRQDSGSFLKLPHSMIGHENFQALAPRAVKLLISIASQYRGDNNGDLTTAWRILQPMGWTSKDQMEKARKELLERGWIVLTRQGRRPKVASLYAVTWLPINECSGKLERSATRTALHWWKLGYNPEEKTLSETRRTGHSCPATRVNGAESKESLPRHTGHMEAFP